MCLRSSTCDCSRRSEPCCPRGEALATVISSRWPRRDFLEGRSCRLARPWSPPAYASQLWHPKPRPRRFWSSARFSITSRVLRASSGTARVGACSARYAHGQTFSGSSGSWTRHAGGLPRLGGRSFGMEHRKVAVPLERNFRLTAVVWLRRRRPDHD
jgi:hypothetical protein